MVEVRNGGMSGHVVVGWLVLVVHRGVRLVVAAP